MQFLEDVPVRKKSRKLPISDMRSSNLFIPMNRQNSKFTATFHQEQTFYQKIQFITSTQILNGRVNVSVRSIHNILATQRNCIIMRLYVCNTFI